MRGTGKAVCFLVALLVGGVGWAQAGQAPAAPSTEAPVQAAPAGSTSGVSAGPVGSRRVETPVEGLTRRGADTVAAAISGGELLLHGFEFEGNAVDTGKLHFRRISPTAVEITSLAYSLGEWRFLVRDRASYYGLGEHFDTLNRAHTIVRNASEDSPGAKGGVAYKPMPFFMSTTGYGLWVDTTAEATFDMNLSSVGEVAITVPADRLRIVLFTAPEFPKMLEEFTGLTERAVLPPYWAFAPWMGRDYHQNEAQVQEDVERTRALGLPASVIVIDSPWATAYNSYKFNPKQFGDARAMVKRVHEAGYKLVLWHTPWINSKSDVPGEAGFEGKLNAHSENYDEAAAHGYFVKRPDGTTYVGRWWKGEGSLIDFTNPAAKTWWQDQVRGVMHVNGMEGADGFKDDDAEGSFLGEVKFADGSSPEVMRGRYGVLYNNAMEELIQKDLKGNGVLYARSVTQGANGIGFLWAGDNESSFSVENGLPTAVMAGLNAGMSGMPLWTADLGGYLKTATTPDPVVEARWTEFASMTPTMEILSQANTQPWNWDKTGTQALDIYRKYAVLHMSLFPYRYAAARGGGEDGDAVDAGAAAGVSEGCAGAGVPGRVHVRAGPAGGAGAGREHATGGVSAGGAVGGLLDGCCDGGGTDVGGGCCAGRAAPVGAGRCGAAEDSRGRDDAGSGGGERQQGGEDHGRAAGIRGVRELGRRDDDGL